VANKDRAALPAPETPHPHFHKQRQLLGESAVKRGLAFFFIFPAGNYVSMKSKSIF
jgi:hypothetical protein